MADSAHVAALKRQRAHLKDVGADEGKLQENAELLRLAGVDPDAEDKPKEEPKRETAPSGSRKRTTDAPTAPKRNTSAK